MTRKDGRDEHFTKYDELARWLGIPALVALIPFSRERVAAALASGDEHLNTLPLRAWDDRHGTPRQPAGTCKTCGRATPAVNPTGGVLGLVRAALRRDVGGTGGRVSRAWSLCETVCVLKHVATHYYAVEPDHPAATDEPKGGH